MKNQTAKLTPNQTASLMAALGPVKADTKGKLSSKAKAKAVNPKVVDAADAITNLPAILSLPAPDSSNPTGVFGGVITDLGKVITKPKTTKPTKPTDTQRAELLGLGVNGNAIKQVAKRCTGVNSAAVIWHAIDNYRAVNNGIMPTVDYIDNLKLMCIKRGAITDSRVNRGNISPEMWAYRCYYQIGGAKRKPGQKKANA
jgi:hypothetical protein